MDDDDDDGEVAKLQSSSNLANQTQPKGQKEAAASHWIRLCEQSFSGRGFPPPGRCAPPNTSPKSTPGCPGAYAINPENPTSKPKEIHQNLVAWHTTIRSRSSFLQHTHLPCSALMGGHFAAHKRSQPALYLTALWLFTPRLCF